MNQHDLDILELGLRAKNEIWAENRGPAACWLAIRIRFGTEPPWARNYACLRRYRP